MLSLSRRNLLLSALPASLLLRGQDNPVYSSDVKVVNVLATVRDKTGKVKSGLTKDDFTVKEDGAVQQIQYFAQEKDLLLTLGLLVDTSLSQRGVLGEEKSASYKFFEQILREDKDQAFVLHFDHDAELLQDLTTNRRQLESALSQLELPADQRGGGRRGGPGGGPPSLGDRAGTVLYDSVLLASDELTSKQTGRKALILLTDGVDFGSKVSLDRAIESALRANTLVYSILFAGHEGLGQRAGGFGGGFPGGGGRGGGGGRRGGGFPGGGYPGGGGGYPGGGTPGGGGGGRQPRGERPDGRKVLERLARETGGGFFEVTKKQTLAQIYETIQQELRSQYNLGYTPEHAAAPGEYRHIMVTTRQTDLMVQARDGYYGAK